MSRAELEGSYQRQLYYLEKIRQGLADVTASRERLEQQIETLDAEMDKRIDQGLRFLQVGRSDMTQEVLNRMQALRHHIKDLHGQYMKLQQEEKELNGGVQSMQAKVEAFRRRIDDLH